MGCGQNRSPQSQRSDRRQADAHFSDCDRATVYPEVIPVAPTTPALRESALSRTTSSLFSMLHSLRVLRKPSKSVKWRHSHERLESPSCKSALPPRQAFSPRPTRPWTNSPELTNLAILMNSAPAQPMLSAPGAESPRLDSRKSARRDRPPATEKRKECNEQFW
jgi:hypothetical protein